MRPTSVRAVLFGLSPGRAGDRPGRVVNRRWRSVGNRPGTVGGGSGGRLVGSWSMAWVGRVRSVPGRCMAGRESGRAVGGSVGRPVGGMGGSDPVGTQSVSWAGRAIGQGRRWWVGRATGREPVDDMGRSEIGRHPVGGLGRSGPVGCRTGQVGVRRWPVGRGDWSGTGRLQDRSGIGRLRGRSDRAGRGFVGPEPDRALDQSGAAIGWADRAGLRSCRECSASATTRSAVADHRRQHHPHAQRPGATVS